MVRGVVAVTGATGFIASHIVAQLLHRGYAVRGTVRNAWKAWHLVQLPGAQSARSPPRLSLHQANLREAGSFEDAVAGCDAVVHCASPFFFSSVTNPDEELLLPAVEGTQNVLEACAKSPSVKRVVLTSSVAAVAYRDVGADHVFTSDDWSDEDMLREREMYYMLSKTMAERAAWRFMEERDPGFDMVAINPTLVTGPMLQPVLNTSSEIVLKYLVGARDLIPKTTFQYVDVRDVAAAHVGALTSDAASGKRYLAVGGCCSASELVKTLAEVAPDAKLPTEAEEGTQRDCINIDAEPLLRDLGLPFYTPLDVSMEDTVASLRRSPYLGFGDDMWSA